MKLHRLAILSLSLLSVLLLGCSGNKEEKTDCEKPYKIVAYYPSYKAASSVIPEATLKKITHVNFSFALPKEDGSLDCADVTQSVKRTASLTRSSGVKVLVSVGGGGDEKMQHAFAAAIHDKTSRDILVDNLMKMVEDLSLDGLDIDYEAWKLKDEQYDLELCSALEDFLSNLKTRLGKDRLLTSAVCTYGKYTPAMVDSFDYVTVMAYDLTGPWTENAGPHSPFEFFTSAIGIFQQMGFPNGKIVPGVPFYGRGFPGGSTKDAYAITYGEIVDKYPGAENQDCVNGELWYDGLQTITKKCNYVKDNSLGGIMFWEITQDSTDPKKSLLDRISSLLSE